MPAVNAYLSWESELTGTRDTRTGLRRWTVLVDDPTTGEIDAGLAPQIPRIDTPWNDQDYWLQVSDIKCRPINPHLWEVTVTYTTRDPSDYPADAPAGGTGPGPWGSPGIGGGPGTSGGGVVFGYEPSPLDRPPEITWSFASSTEPIDCDIFGKPILNTAGQAFDPGPTREFNDLCIIISRNEPAFNPAVMLAYQDAVNADAWYVAAPGQARITQINAQLQTDWTTPYYRVSYQIQLRADGWMKRILNKGTRAKIDVDPNGRAVLEVNTDAKGQPAGEILLDADGKALPEGAPEVWTYWHVYPELPFAPLGLM